MLAAEKHQATPFAPVRIIYHDLVLFLFKLKGLDRHWTYAFLMPPVRIIVVYPLHLNSCLDR